MELGVTVEASYLERDQSLLDDLIDVLNRYPLKFGDI